MRRRSLGLTLVLILALGVPLATAGPALADPGTHWVNDDGVAVPPGTGCEHPGYNTIQAAVAAANPGDRINVCVGNYVEQVTIPSGKNDLTLRAVGHWRAVIRAPAAMADPKAIVRVNGAQNVTILGFTITGPGGTLCDSLRWGVRVDNGGSANILGNHITLIRDNPFSGCQNGVAVIVGRQAEGQTGSARIIGNVIDLYQKNGPTVDNAGSFAEIAHNRIIGSGPTAVNAQNGVQVSRGATAEVEHNFISGNVYTGAGFSASGVILFEHGSVVVEYNSISANDVGINVADTTAFGGLAQLTTVVHNRIRGSTYDGVALFPATDALIARNRLDANTGPGIGLYDSTLNTVRNNQIDDNADSGVLLDNADDNTISANHVRDNGTAAGDTTDGIRANMFSTGNTIEGNRLRHNLTHDCHDDSLGVANFWIDNHGQTSQPPGLCEPGGGDDSFASAETFGWDANYPWYAGFGDAADYDWAAAYATVDTDSLLQLLAELPLRSRGVAAPNP